MLRCDIFDQGMSYTLLLCGKCVKALKEEGASMRCYNSKESKGHCAQCFQQSKKQKRRVG